MPRKLRVGDVLDPQAGDAEPQADYTTVHRETWPQVTLVREDGYWYSTDDHSGGFYWCELTGKWQIKALPSFEVVASPV